MAKALLGISILIVLCAAGLGFMTSKKVEAKVTDLTNTKKTLASTEKTLSTTKDNLEKTTGELATTKTDLDDTKTKLTAAETSAKEAKDAAEKAAAEVKEKETLLAEANKKLDDMKNPVVGAPTENPVVNELQKKVEDATAKQKEAELAAEQYKNRQKAAEENLVAAQNRIKQYENPIRQAGLTGRILHVSPGWNFVVIDVGDKQGVTVNSPLLVMRGNTRVATLKITSVEPRQAIADVVPGSMARGAAVQVGDRVVFAGTRGQPPTVLPPAETPAPGPGAAPAPPVSAPN
jgi:hypothetical protein